MLRKLGHEPGSVNEREWHDVAAHAINTIDRHTYIVCDAHTLAPIPGHAAITGRIGIAADVARDFPGLTARRADECTPEHRESLAATLDDMADTCMRMIDMYRGRMLEWAHKAAAATVGTREQTSAALAADKLANRIDREAAEWVRCTTRAKDIREALASA